MKKLLIPISILFTLSACSSAPNQAQASTSTIQSVEATVISTEQAPLICDRERKHNKRSVLGAAVVGGLIGNQIGSGSGRRLATVTGAVVAGQATNKRNQKTTDTQNCYSDGWNSKIRFINPYTRQVETQSINTNQQVRVGQRIRTQVRIETQ